MPSKARLALAVTSLLVLVGTGGLGAWAYHALDGALPTPGHVAGGVRIDGVEVPKSADPAAFVQARVDAILDRPVDLKHGADLVARTTLRELGATVDVDRVVASALEIGRRGDWWARALDATRSRHHGTSLSLPVSVPVEGLAELVAPWKEEHDSRPRGARRTLGAEPRVIPHEPGRYVDVYATVEAILGAARRGEASADLRLYAWTPAATADAARDADVSQVVGAFETRFGGPAGRDKNIARAAGALDGIVLAPGDTVSFNDLVGPRSEENGFFPAPEISKGGMREGIGDGSCQVASTL